MQKVLLFGASGNLGKEIAAKAVAQGYDLTVVVRNKARGSHLSAITTSSVIADITQPSALAGICKGFDIVISALGKSISLNDNSKPSFIDIDLIANLYILEDAIISRVRKFVYVSAFGAEKYVHLAYFRAHHEFAGAVQQSGLSYAIIKPPALFSSFIDLMSLAKRGRLLTVGAGDKRTNPIYEGDLATICVNSITARNAVIAAGGKHIYSRRELNNLIQAAVAPGRRVRSIPGRFISLSLPVVRIFNRNMYDKLAFFREVLQQDIIAPLSGDMSFEDYLKMKSST